MQTRDGHKSILTSSKIIYKQSRVIFIKLVKIFFSLINLSKSKSLVDFFAV